jgi:hypothetical protein
LDTPRFCTGQVYRLGFDRKEAFISFFFQPVF